MFSPRSVTLQPIGMPSRSLKPAIDLRASVVTGFWPLICVICSIAWSSAFESVFASETPMFSVILTSFGACIGDE
jgi:hypothetical protein